MTGISPQTAVHDPALAGRIRFKLRQLPVTYGFENKSGGPENKTQAGQEGEIVLLRIRRRLVITSIDESHTEAQEAIQLRPKGSRKSQLESVDVL